MANQPLVGQVPVQLNFVPVTTITNVTSKRNRTNQVKKGAYGAIGTAKGVPGVSGTFELALPQAGLEFDLELLWDSPQGFTLTYQVGVKRYMLLGCQVESDDLANTPESGDAKITVSFTATDRKRLN